MTEAAKKPSKAQVSEELQDLEVPEEEAERIGGGDNPPPKSAHGSVSVSEITVSKPTDIASP
jgi:hypothetical protein